MAATVVRVDTGRAERSLNDPRVRRAAIEAAAIEATNAIRDRTTNGRDIAGLPFKPYSPRYRAWKEKETGRGARVDLTLHNDMLRNFQPVAISMDGKTAWLGFPDATENAKAVRNNETRPWLGIKDRRSLRRLARAYAAGAEKAWRRFHP